LALLLTTTLMVEPSRRAVAADALLVVNQVSLERFPEVVVYFTVVDSAGLPITDISKDRVQVLHNGRLVPDLALDLAEAEQEGLAVAVAIDTSGSMQGQPLEDARSAVRIFLDQMGPRDRGALVSFGQSVQVVQDLTDDRAALDQALNGLVARGDTALYDGTFQAITIAARHSLGRRTVVVITDGEDTHSSLTLDDVIGKARETNTPVSVIAFGEVKLEPVERLALVTGGSLSVAPDSGHLAERTMQVSQLLRKQYVLRYRAPDTRPPENELELVLNQSGQQIRASQRFQAPPMPPLTVSLADLTPGSTVRGIVDLRPTIADTARVDRVEYVLDGTAIGSIADAPYAFTWDTSSVTPGEHVLTVRAQLGEQEGQHVLPLTVAPAIQLSIRLPAGQEISGRVRLLAELESGLPIANVAWAVDGQPIGSSAQPPYEIEWDSTGLPAGEHVVTAEARDERGSVGRANQTVRVLPAGAVAGSTVAPGTPASNATAGPAGTATPASTRAATSTPAGTTDSDLLERVSPAVWIGGAAVLAIVIGLIYAFSRRRADVATGPTAVIAPPATARLALPGDRRFDSTQAGYAGATSDDPRTAEMDMVTIPPAQVGEQVGAPPLEPSQATLTVTMPGTPPRSWPLGFDQIIGRAAAPGVIVVDDPQVSRRHARISWEGGHFVYRDLGPMNPTRRDGRTLPNPYILRDGDRLRVGHSELTFHA
jgi:VWFA-related protein